MNYKAIFIDLDGTLVPETMLISPRTHQSILRIKNHVKVIIVSGRPQEIVLEFAIKLGLSDHQICDGGARIVSIDNRQIWATFIDILTCKKIINIARRLGIENIACSDNGHTVFSVNDIQSWRIPKIAFLSMPERKASMLYSELNVLPNISPIMTRQNNQTTWNIDITNIYGTKLYGVKHFLELSGISKSETIGIGDGYNDIPLLNATGLKIAMDNAPKDVKDISHFITPNVYNDGLAIAIEKYL